MPRFKLRRKENAGLFAPEVLASQWFKNGDHPLDYASNTEGFEDGKLRTFTGQERRKLGWEGWVIRYYRLPGSDGLVCSRCKNLMKFHGWIDVSPDGLTVCPGDYVALVGGYAHIPIDPTAFEAIYEEVDPPTAPPAS